MTVATDAVPPARGERKVVRPTIGAKAAARTDMLAGLMGRVDALHRVLHPARVGGHGRYAGVAPTHGVLIFFPVSEPVTIPVFRERPR